MRDIPVVPIRISDALHGGASLDSTAGRSGQRTGSKPSDGLQSRFPVYGYRDLVHAQYRLVTEGLGVDHLKVILGSSMGGMHAWLWAEHNPAMMDAIVPIACSPVAVTGRNYLWRHLIIEAIKHDPEYHEGRYRSQPRSFQRVLPVFSSKPADEPMITVVQSLRARADRVIE